MKLGRFARLGIVLSLWFVPIATVTQVIRAGNSMGEIASIGAKLCYSTASAKATPTPDDYTNCTRQHERDLARIGADAPRLWRTMFLQALALCAIGWLIGFLLYLSVRWILRG